jgi:hypothetical protein
MHAISRQCVAPGRALRVEVVRSSSGVRLGALDDPSSCDREEESGGEARLPEGGSFAWISAAACDQARGTDVSERDKLTFFGMPEAIDLLLLLLDLGEDREILRVIQQLGATVDGAPQEQRSLLRSRLRNLEMSASSDAVADAAADLLGQL